MTYRQRTLLLAAAILLPFAVSASPMMSAGLNASLVIADADDQIRRQVIRRRPGHPPPDQREAPEIDPARVMPVSARNIGDYGVPVPDRWRIMESLGIEQNWWDPYNQNTYKADKPLFDDWFLNILAISDTVIEPRSIPTPVGLQSTTDPGSIDIFGDIDQSIFAQTFIVGRCLLPG